MEKDYLLRAMTKDGFLRAFALNSKNMVAEAGRLHGACSYGRIGKAFVCGRNDGSDVQG